MTETIVSIQPCETGEKYRKEAGFAVLTTDQEILLLIDDEDSCCESWGYFLTEDDTDKFLGAQLTGIAVTDTNRSKKEFVTDYSDDSNSEEKVYLEDGDVLFVDIQTDRGVLQFVAYNAHNGYYGHIAKVVSKQLQHEVTL